MKILQDILSEKYLGQLKKSAFPGFVPPMLATLTDDYFNDPHWLYERKLDGVRCLVCIQQGNVVLSSRNENDISHTYPELVKVLQRQNLPDLIADGEIVAFKGKLTSFGKLQGRMQLQDAEKIANTRVKVYLYLFDLIYFKNYDLTELPLRQRKRVLKKAFQWQSPLRYTPHKNQAGTEYLKDACEKGWEGLIAKDATASYVHSRSRNWLKFKCSKGQELVIGGFTEPQGERVGFGALLVGYYKNGSLQYAGKVGTGFDDDFLKKWRQAFDKIERKTSPFQNFDDPENGNLHWIAPKYVGQFGFTEWTKAGKLRHPRFLGMRNDKEAKNVIKEQ